MCNVVGMKAKFEVINDASVARLEVRLDRKEWGQVVDGLVCRAEQYEMTARYYETGDADGEILDVRDAEEANHLSQTYREIIRRIAGQVG